MTTDYLNHDSYDVLVAGGGPAGAVTAALVARAGYRVLLVERSPAPEFKVGESLMPASYWTFERLGLLERLRASAFPVKGSVQFFSSDGRAATPFYFEDHDPHESSLTWQVLRSDFDAMLLEAAAESGAEIRRGVGVQEVLLEGERAVGAYLKSDSSGRRQVRSRIVVDATGQRALLARQLALLEPDPRLLHASFFTHFQGARRDTGRDAGATLILHTREHRSWFWFIPLPDDRVSVGVVGSVDRLVRGRESVPQAVFDAELDACPALQSRLASARQVRPVMVLRDFSYRVSQMAGAGWVAVGDAAGFIDPIYSTGVFLALKSGEMAADAICEALARDDLSAATLRSFEPALRRGMGAMRRLVYAFYDPRFSFGRFMNAHPECRGQLVDLLMGNVFRRPVDELLEALEATLARDADSRRPEVPA